MVMRHGGGADQTAVPDRAIAFREGRVNHIYFVAETKGSMPSLELRAMERKKIGCARKFFEALNREINPENVRYDLVNSYEKLMEIVGKESGAA